MALETGHVVLTAVPTLICPPDTHGGHVINVHNPSNNKSVYVGTGSVSISSGFEIPKGETRVFTLSPVEHLYGIVDSGSVEISFILTHG